MCSRISNFLRSLELNTIILLVEDLKLILYFYCLKFKMLMWIYPQCVCEKGVYLYVWGIHESWNAKITLLFLNQNIFIV